MHETTTKINNQFENIDFRLCGESGKWERAARVRTLHSVERKYRTEIPQMSKYCELHAP